MSRKQWKRVAELADSAFLSQWRAQQLVYADADKIERDNKKKHQKQYGLPKCVQKYFESQESHYSDTFLKGFAGAKSIAQLETLSPEQLFASWLAGGDAVKSNERTTTRTILGEVPGERLRHARDLPHDAHAPGHQRRRRRAHYGATLQWRVACRSERRHPARGTLVLLAIGQVIHRPWR